MATEVEIIGVHRVPVDASVYLIEIEVDQSVESFDFGEVTQEIPGQPTENWQVAYDERELRSGEGKVRFAFFFHDLDPGKPLRTSYGSVKVPAVSPIPPHLREIEYEAP